MTRPRGRPSTGVRVDIRIPADMLELIDRDASYETVSRAERIREIIDEHYEQRRITCQGRESWDSQSST